MGRSEHGETCVREGMSMTDQPDTISIKPIARLARKAAR